MNQAEHHQPDQGGKELARDGRSPGGVVIVGTCASGKSTLADHLRRLGYPVQVVAQEHSDIEHLWQRSNPAVVIALQTDLATLRKRRGRDWPETLFETQRRRLASAVAAATAVIDTGALSELGTLATATGAIRGAGVHPEPRE